MAGLQTDVACHLLVVQGRQLVVLQRSPKLESSISPSYLCLLGLINGARQCEIVKKHKKKRSTRLVLCYRLFYFFLPSFPFLTPLASSLCSFLLSHSFPPSPRGSLLGWLCSYCSCMFDLFFPFFFLFLFFFLRGEGDFFKFFLMFFDGPQWR